jgi:hypothetical protein
MLFKNKTAFRCFKLEGRSEKARTGFDSRRWGKG